MEIKEFKVISSQQRKELYNFIKSTDSTYNKSYLEMTRIYESDTFNDGNTVFIIFQKGQIKGSLALITKEISVRGEAFITDIYVKKENAEIFLNFLIKKIVEYCNMCSAISIKIGIRESEKHLIPYINKFEFSHIYDAVVIGYRGDKNTSLKLNKDMELRPLCISNSQEYMNIHNEAFKNSPNGGTIDEVEVKDYIVQYANNEDLIGICFFNKKPCGIYELSNDGNIGWIDSLAITPSFQHMGLGKLLLVKCINKLYEKKLDEIKLLVITSNEIAMAMYRDMGFDLECVFSYWFEKK
ncbi:GNAT family N-acetyltransferase [Clostridium estertheticum]|uniref:GNAT family N-acetyltransferase n=1 Tax=Clostridium estertheticum TaxID=238834 RepID=UPI0013E989E6|nr:GNAT family N-acetyltransferase [Clostridium estertheticum]MBZ9685148.1 GNAT family N-acetyltransferase [Clostridium estertheticum]